MEIIIIIAIIGIIFYIKIIKPIIILNKLKLDSFTLITGGVKTGKSTLAIYLAISKLKYVRLIEKIKNIFRKEKKELPVLYSNIPIDIYDNEKGEAIKNIFRKKKNKKKELIQYELTREILLREEIPIEKSVIYIGEFSLVADSMNWQDMYTNEKIMLFFKLFGHSFAGSVFVDTQSISDCHFAVKKISTKYIWIYRARKKLLTYDMNIKEIAYNYENNGIVNAINKENIEEETNLIKINKKIWKIFNYRAYKILNKGKTIARKKGTRENGLYQDYIVSFNKWKTKEMQKGAIKNEK